LATKTTTNYGEGLSPQSPGRRVYIDGELTGVLHVCIRSMTSLPLYMWLQVRCRWYRAMMLSATSMVSWLTQRLSSKLVHVLSSERAMCSDLTIQSRVHIGLKLLWC